MSKRYAIGIDLGTSNSSVALANLTDTAAPRTLPICQQISARALGDRDTLPSALYLPSEDEQRQLPPLPWPTGAEHCCGLYAREHGALLPERLVTSAKSWLGHNHLDPRQPILPWNSRLTQRLLSPCQVQTQFLRHLQHNLRYQLRQQQPSFDLTQAEVVLTVPASFNEVARLLTAEAAREAGWGEVTLLEEPQAAFYHWLTSQGELWREQVQPGDVILVCDIGGGTTDFSLIAVTARQGELALERISVGDHLLLGGDNLDLALAYSLQAQLETQGKKLDHSQFLALVQGCRAGKETLLGDQPPESYPIALASRGASLFARSLTVALTRTLVEQVVFDGFLAPCTIDCQPDASGQAGLQEVGLHYAADPVFSHHLAAFLVASAQAVTAHADLAEQVRNQRLEQGGRAFLFPTAVLFNGGIFRSRRLQQRLFGLLQQFCPERPLRLLCGGDPDLAVARGAASYARQRVAGGLRIKAGTARSYYIGLQAAMPAVPGFKPPLKGVCIVPRGMEEGSEQTLNGREFALLTGQPVEFRFFSSNQRPADTIGDAVEDIAELQECASLQLSLPAEEQQQRVAVQLRSRITELGTLELWLHQPDSQRRWKVEINLRANGGPAA
ncbi:Hsp70 family protein [Desulfuromonas thiophila]|uniref:Hsp70 family protein n=1 Tax=Desulfuromonas thiophila TaxID=57664 RepID=UPI0029F547A1|nr:Hsp70 family protein [Desulfuromonas thiophila]